MRRKVAAFSTRRDPSGITAWLDAVFGQHTPLDLAFPDPQQEFETLTHHPDFPGLLRRYHRNVPHFTDAQARIAYDSLRLFLACKVLAGAVCAKNDEGVVEWFGKAIGCTGHALNADYRLPQGETLAEKVDNGFQQLGTSGSGIGEARDTTRLLLQQTNSDLPDRRKGDHVVTMRVLGAIDHNTKTEGVVGTLRMEWLEEADRSGVVWQRHPASLLLPYDAEFAGSLQESLAWAQSQHWGQGQHGTVRWRLEMTGTRMPIVTGDSMGLAMGIGLYLLWTGCEEDLSIAITGALKANGKVAAVGNIKEKLDAADQESGISVVMLPSDVVNLPYGRGGVDVATRKRILDNPERYKLVGGDVQATPSDLGDADAAGSDAGGTGIRQPEFIAVFQRLRAARLAAHALHQSYLESVIDTVGRLTLANINPEASDVDGALLEEIYVDLPTECVLHAEVKDARVMKWWVGRREQSADRAIAFPAEARQKGRQEDPARSQTLRCDDEEGLQPLIAEAQRGYLEKRARAVEAKARGDRYYNDIKDGVQTITSLSAGYLLGASRRLVVLGAPGSGKSTLVRHLALCLAGEKREPWTRTAKLSRLAGWTHGPLIPIYIELRRFVGSSHFPGVDDRMPSVEDLWNYIRAEILGDKLEGYALQLKQHLKESRALLILDGLDEVPYPAGKGNLAKRRQQIRALAQSINDHYPYSRVVVASRPYAYENWQLEGYSSVHIAPFAAAERIALAANLFRFSGYPEPEGKARRLNTTLEQKGISSELADNPLFLTLMATIFARSDSEEGLPSRKGLLYRESVLLLLERWTKAKRSRPTLTQLLGDTSRDELLERLAELAYRVHEHAGKTDVDTPDVPRAWLRDILFEMHEDDPTVDDHGLWSYLSENAGLLISPGHNIEDHVFRFAHHTFQEYLAAKHLVEKLCLGDFAQIRNLIVRETVLWRTPCLLVGDVLRDSGSERDAFGQLWTLIADLLEDDAPEVALLASDPHWWPVWLSAGIAQEQDLHSQARMNLGHRAVRGALAKWLVKLLETAGALCPQERAHCGRVLGLLGDPRRGVGLHSEGVPDLEWGKPVQPGDYPIGGDKDAYQPLPKQRVSLSYPYRLAKYQVTNAQFQAFVDADAAGYNNPAYWTPEGLEWKSDRRAPDEAGAGAFSLPNHPRVNVCWYEALAFCGWLSARYLALGLLEVGAEIGLPTQIEWEMCARGSDSRLFPYGNAFDATKGNVYEAGIGETSAVGIFPDGASPYEVLDMSGNVWEWCVTAYESGSNDPSGSAVRVLRGGAWFDDDGVARACARCDYSARFDADDVGFRVVCLPHSVKRI